MKIRNSVLVGVLALLSTAATLIPVGGQPAEAATGDVVGWMLSSEGSVTAVGGTTHFGDAPGSAVAAISIVATPTGRGYYIAFVDGSIKAFGDAVHLGDLSDFELDHPVVDFVLNSAGTGYLLLSRDGGVFAFGTQEFLGAAPELVAFGELEGEAVALILGPGGNGYAIVFDDGGVFNFGEMKFHGSVPQYVTRAELRGSIVGGVLSADGVGYALVGRDGGIFAFGSFSYLGSLAASGGTFVAVVEDPNGGYLLLGSTGSVHRFGTVGAVGELLTALAGSVVDFAAVAGIPVETTTTTAKPTTTTAKPTTTTAKPTTTTTQAGGDGGGQTGKSLSLWGSYSQTFTGHDYWTPPQCPNCPNSFLSPTNFSTGTATINIDVKSTASNKTFILQLCMWNHSKGNWQLETCAPGVSITGPGKYTANLGRPSGWWKLNGTAFPWNQGPDVVRVMVKDPTTKTLLMDNKCGKYCYSANDLASRTPITFSAEVVFKG